MPKLKLNDKQYQIIRLEGEARSLTYEGQTKVDKSTGFKIWEVPVLLVGGGENLQIPLRVISEKPDTHKPFTNLVAQPGGLEAIVWSFNGKQGVSYRHVGELKAAVGGFPVV